MAKDPAFLFYSQDFFTGVADLTFEDRGKFISILCLMHQKGRLKEETIRFLVGSVSVSLKSKFLVDENGFWYNQRLEFEIAARVNFVNSRKINGLKGGRPKASGKPKHNLMEDEDVNEIEDENVLENTSKNTQRKKEFLTNQIWKEQFCAGKNIQMTALEKLQAEFIVDADLKGQHVDSYKRYFTNWFNLKHNGTHQPNSKRPSGEKLGTSAARINAIKNWGLSGGGADG